MSCKQTSLAGANSAANCVQKQKVSCAIAWAMQSRQTTDMVLQALLMAVWRKKPVGKVLIHADQGSQFTSIDWTSFLKQQNLEHSMSRRGNYHDNAAAESFFSLLKRERIRRRTYKTRDEERQDVLDYIEMFYNSQRKHVRNGMLSPIKFEAQQELARVTEERDILKKATAYFAKDATLSPM